MKYDELIKDLRICASTFTEPCEECSHTEAGDCYNKLKRNAADAIEELQKQLREEHAKNLWIPVTERLPKLGETVLVCYRWINPSNKLSVTCDFLHIHSTTMKPVWWKHNHSHRVLYWMPLPPIPEPPKDGGR